MTCFTAHVTFSYTTFLQAHPCSSPLARAAEMGHKEAVERLLVAGAVLDYQDKV